jgi:protein TonB
MTKHSKTFIMSLSLLFSLLSFFSSAAPASAPAFFPGEEFALSTYLDDRIKYPELAENNGLEGEVEVAFFVLADGQIIRPKITTPLGMGCDEEVLRVITEMPRWNAAFVDGEPVASRVKIRVRFRLP